MTLKSQLTDDVNTAMRSKDRERLKVLRLVTAAVKQREVDERITLDDADLLGVIDKMIKQRRDAESQFRDAGRDDLATAESAEIDILQAYLPEQLDAAALTSLVDQTIAATGAQSMRDMGKVMADLKPKVQGRADMGAVSTRVKQRLGA